MAQTTRIIALVIVIATTFALELYAADKPSFANFDSFVDAYKNAHLEERSVILEEFTSWQSSHGGFPITEKDGSAIFLYVGDGNETDVKLLGDFLPRSYQDFYWDPMGVPMLPIVEGAPVYFKKLKFEPNARFDYRFRVNDEGIIDPLNNTTIYSGVGDGEASVITMPEYEIAQETISRPNVSQGKLEIVEKDWADHKVRIYLPANYDPSQSYPVVYTADGSAWEEIIGLPTILDNLISDGTITPVIAVMIDTAPNRRSWYYYNPEYLNYLQKAIEYVDSHYATFSSPDKRVHIGSSAGGRTAYYTALERPDLILNLGLFSPSFSGSPSFFEPYFSGAKRPNKKIRIWMCAGTYEQVLYQDALIMERYFKKVGLSTTTNYSHEGHSFGNWRNQASAMLKHYFSTPN